MAVINYTNIDVNVGGSPVFANSASYSFSVPIEGVRALGQKNAIANIPNGPVEGTLNIDYIITTTDPGNTIFQSIVNNPGTYAGTSVSIGGQTFTNAYLTSHSLTAEANSIVNGSLSFTVYEEGGGTMSSSAAGVVIDSPIGHGTASSVAIANATSFEYNASVEFEPAYVLDSTENIGVTFRSAQQTLDIRGFNLGKAITQCPEDAGTVNVSIGAVCGGGNLVDISIAGGKIATSESSVSAGGFVEGSYQIIKNY
jgi:hypothetical protein